jgi:coproporphyrinogen III oxidase-like Fe-S oxidoreductase
VKRVFLVNGDAFVLSASRLKAMAEKIIGYFPEVEVITMYASINNIKTKTDAELKELEALRLNELWVGVETADKETLEYLHKGFTLEESRFNLKRLQEVGIRFYQGFMYGAAGKGKGIEIAIKNASLINEVKPMGLAPTTLKPNEGSQLAKDVSEGKFLLATEREIFDEMNKLIELVDTDGLIYYGFHVINTIPFNCRLPRDRQKALDYIDKRISEMDDNYLDSIPKRHTI